MKHTYTLQNKEISLVPLSLDWSEEYRNLRNRPEIKKWFRYNGEISREDQIQWFENYLQNENDIMFAIINASGSFLGCNSIYNIDRSRRTAEYGRLIIDPVYSGKGYGYFATECAVSIAKSQLLLKKLFLEVYEDNYSAIATYHKAGFKDEGSVFDDRDNKLIKMVLDLKK